MRQCIQALGGEAYLNLQDMEQEGRTYSFYNGQPRSVGAPYWRFWKWPDKERIELTKKRDVVYVYNADKGYEITFRGTAAEQEESMTEYVRQRHFSLPKVLREWLPASGTALFYDGPAVVERKPTDTVSIMNASNEQVTLYLDVNTHLPIQKTFFWRDKDRFRVQDDEVYDNYKPVQSVMTPYSLIRKRDGQMLSQRFIDAVRYNTGLADSLFEATATWDPYKRSGPRR
ncbi:MAG: hypothetical protein AB7O65_07175 [Candidatus Korobacteraceae bacterium]